MSTEIERLEGDLEDSFKTIFEGNLWGVMKQYVKLKAQEEADSVVTPDGTNMFVVTVSDNYTALVTDNLIRVNVVEKTITLPSLDDAWDAGAGKGIRLDIKKTVNQVGNVYITVNDTLTETINGPTTNDATKTMTDFNDNLTIVATANGWEVI